MIAAAAFVDREVAFEHGSSDAEGLDARLDVGAPGVGELFGRRRQSALVNIETEQTHAEAAELDADVRTLRELANRFAPLLEHFVAPAGVGTDADRSADMIENHRRVRASARERNHLVELRVIHPRIERKTEGRQTSQSLAQR